MEIEKRIQYKDYSIDAELADSGTLRLLEGVEAVENSLRLWISSFKGEIIRQPNKGGYITRWLMKPITEDTRMAIKRAILDGLIDEFEPVLIPTKVEVTPNYEKEFWEIHIEAYSPTFREQINIIENIRKLT